MEFMEQPIANQPSRPAPYPASLPSNGSVGSSPLQTLGALLRERREQRSISLAEVEKATRIRQKYLAAIEADEWHLLPGEVVGRGFLRNYAIFLRLDADSLIERRRAATDPTLARSLSRTSAGSALPPVREVDYRPKDVDLVETPVGDILSEYVAAGRDWFAPIVTALFVIGIIFVLGWGLRQMGTRVADLLDGLQDRAVSIAPAIGSETVVTSTPTMTPAVAVVGGVGGPGAGEPTVVVSGGGTGSTGGGEVATPVTGGGVVIPPPPTDTPTPLPPPPTDTPVPVVQAPACPDGRALIFQPGVNQVVSGFVPVIGSATHDQFDYYKLEFAPGANAEGGFVYFDGTAVQISGGVLGNFNSPGVPNGVYTIRLIVVDTTGNFPPPCSVTVTVQN